MSLTFAWSYSDLQKVYKNCTLHVTMLNFNYIYITKEFEVVFQEENLRCPILIAPKSRSPAVPE
jgi:hypothetical protein